MTNLEIVFTSTLAILIVLMVLLTWMWIKITKLTYSISTYKQQLIEKDAEITAREAQFKEQLERKLKENRTRSNTAQRSVIKGQIGEQFTPFIADFPYNPSDCKFMGAPIDYVIFHNLHQCSEGKVPIESVQIIIAEVKTGNARLNHRQRILRQAVENGQVAFKELRIKEVQHTGKLTVTSK